MLPFADPKCTCSHGMFDHRGTKGGSCIHKGCPCGVFIEKTISPPPENTVRIFVGAGMSFEVPRSFYDEALICATMQRRIWFVGLAEGNRVEVGPDRLALWEKGCTHIAWVPPASKALAMGVEV